MQRTLLLSLIALSYILFAGGPRWTLIPLLALTAGTALVAPRRTFSFPRDSRALDLALIALVAALTLQITPVPRAVVERLSPRAGDLRATLQFQSAMTPARARLSVDPSKTAEALAVVTMAVLCFWVARGLFSGGGRTRQFCRALALIGAAAAVSAVIFREASPGLVHGALQPDARSANPFGAFVNRNHFAGWLLLVAAPVCGYLIAHLRIHPAYSQRSTTGLKHFMTSGAMVIAMGAVTVVGVLLLTLSRSGAAGLAAAVLFGWLAGRRRMQVERVSLPVILTIGVVVLLTAMLFVDVAGWATRLEEAVEVSSDRNRITIWRESLPIVYDFWFSGTGAGTFSDAMAKYQQTRVWVGSMNRWAHFNNAHSHYVQVMVEGGLLLVIPAASALLSAVARARRLLTEDRGEMQWGRIGACAGLMAIAVQSVWETALVMPANAILFGTVAGLALYQRPEIGRRQPSAGGLEPRGAAR